MTKETDRQDARTGGVLQSESLFEHHIVHSLHGVNLVAKNAERHMLKFGGTQKTLQLLSGLVEAVAVSGINHENNSVNLGEVILPDTAGLLVASEIVGLESDTSDHELLKLRVSSGLVLHHL